MTERGNGRDLQLFEGCEAFVAGDGHGAQRGQIVRQQHRGRFTQPGDAGFMAGVLERHDQPTLAHSRRGLGAGRARNAQDADQPRRGHDGTLTEASSGGSTVGERGNDHVSLMPRRAQDAGSARATLPRTESDSTHAGSPAPRHVLTCASPSTPNNASSLVTAAAW